MELRILQDNGAVLSVSGADEETVHRLVVLVLGVPSNIQSQLDALDRKLSTIIDKEQTIMNKEIDFEKKIDEINANTTASAAAAQKIADMLTALRTQLTTALAGSGLTAAEQDAIFSKLDASAQTASALNTFLQATAADPTVPEPLPVTPPAPQTSAV